MRSILEQAVIHHLNGDSDKAQEMFHQFIVTRARQIHESMRNGEDPLVEGFDDISSEEYFNESELDELEALEDDNVDGEEFGGEADLDDGIDGEEAAGELGDELGIDGEENAGDEAAFGDEATGDEALGGDTEELEARVEDLEAELERLVAKFDDDQGEEGDDADLAGGLDDDMAGDVAAGGEDADFRMESAEADDEDEDEDAFDTFAEGFDLESVTASVADATEVGTGSKINGNAKSGLPQKNAAARQGGQPVVIKSSTHTGFAKETAPSVASMKARKNNVAKADTGRAPVAAPSNKEAAKNTKSPVISTKGLTK